MLTVTARPGATLSLGREGENLARKIVFDVSRWQAEYGPGSVSLIAQRQGDAEPYPCAITVDGAAVTWPVTSADAAKPGYGKCELRYRVDDTLVKSESWRTFVADALGEPTPEPPEPQQAWVDKVLAAGAASTNAAKTAQAAAEQAESAAVNPPKIGDDGNWYVWAFEAGKYVDTGVAATGPAGEPGQQGNPGPQGKPGQQGPNGEPGYTPQRGVDYWTPEDQQAIVDAVLAALPDGDDDIILDVGSLGISIETEEIQNIPAEVSTELKKAYDAKRPVLLYYDTPPYAGMIGRFTYTIRLMDVLILSGLYAIYVASADSVTLNSLLLSTAIINTSQNTIQFKGTPILTG